MIVPGVGVGGGVVSIVVVTLELLLVLTGSVSVALTDALLVTTPDAVGLNTTFTCAVAFNARFPTAHDNVPDATLQVPCVMLLET